MAVNEGNTMKFINAMAQFYSIVFKEFTSRRDVVKQIFNDDLGSLVPWVRHDGL